METRSHQLFQVFLDTEFFIRNNFQFKSSRFKEIIKLVKTNKISLYSTQITNLEIKANIEKEVKETLEYFKFKNQKDYKLLRNFDRFNNLFERFNVELLTQELLNEYINFYRESNTDEIENRIKNELSKVLDYLAFEYGTYIDLENFKFPISMTSFTATWLKDIPKCKPLLLSIPLFSLALPRSANSLFIFSEECDLWINFNDIE